ncbi:MAG: helix-turn-helix domain-containing protein [Roseibium sp.]|nr:helix-turn-helix domain-containing protein [Roseibium sp.]
MAHVLTIYREKAGLTKAELGRRLGVGRAAVLKWENGRVPAERALSVEEVTGIPRWELRPDIYPREATGAA